MEVYKDKEHELRNTIDSILSLNSDFENYVNEVNSFIDILENEIKEFNVLKYKNARMKYRWDELKSKLEANKNERKYAGDVYRFTAYEAVLKWMEELEGEDGKC